MDKEALGAKARLVYSFCDSHVTITEHIPSVTCPDQDKVFPTWKWGSPLREAVRHFLFWDAMDLLEVAKNIVDLLLDLVFVILLSLLSSLSVSVLRRLQMLTR